MPALTSDTIDRMVLEDPWLGTLNGCLLTLVRSSGQSLGELRHIEQAELDLADPAYAESPGLHYILGEAYHALREEPTYEFKLAIEQAKLARIGRPDLLDFGQRRPADIIASLPHRGAGMGENIMAALDYIESHNIRAYLHLRKAARTYDHFLRAVNLSKRNPTEFRHIIEPAVLMYMAPITIGLRMPEQDVSNYYGSNLLLEKLGRNLKAAQERLGVKF